MVNKITKNKLKNITKSKILWLLLTLFIFAALIFLVWMRFEKIRGNSEDILSAKLDTALFKVQVKEVEDFKLNYNKYLPNFQKIDQFIVSVQNPLDFIEFLEGLAFDNGLSISMSPFYGAKKAELGITSAQLSVAGGFSDILQFLKELEDSRYLVSIQDLAIEYDERAKRNRANITINILTN